MKPLVPLFTEPQHQSADTKAKVTEELSLETNQEPEQNDAIAQEENQGLWNSTKKIGA